MKSIADDLENFDANLDDADWTKTIWDLPPYKSAEFNALNIDLHAFRELPVYKNAVKNGLIVADQWAKPILPTPGAHLTSLLQGKTL